MDANEILDWLVASDPSLRWQVERDLLHAGPEVWKTTRARVPLEGHGAEVLRHQDEDGLWAGGAYFPADATPEEPGQPFTATTWSLTLLRRWGVSASALRPGTAALIARNARWEYDDLPYWGGEVDVCINAMTLANGAWLGVDVRGLARWFPEHEVAEGGWNCEWEHGSTRASFHSTLNALVGLLEYEQIVGGDAELAAARARAEEYLLERHLLRSLSSGELLEPWATHLAYPYWWFYSVPKALDYFRAARLHDGAPADPRLAEAVGHLRDARDADGTWHQQLRHEGRRWVEEDAGAGEPSKWLTFHALRVLEWFDGQHA